MSARALATRARASARQGSTYVQNVYGSGQDAIEGRRKGSIVMMVIGYSLLAILVYIAIADKSVVSALTGIAGLGSNTINAWIKPVDPIAHLISSLGITGTPSPSGTGTSGQAEGVMVAGSPSSLPGLPPPPAAFAGPNHEPPVSRNFPLLSRSGPFGIASRRVQGRSYTFGEYARAEAWKARRR